MIPKPIDNRSLKEMGTPNQVEVDCFVGQVTFDLKDIMLWLLQHHGAGGRANLASSRGRLSFVCCGVRNCIINLVNNCCRYDLNGSPNCGQMAMVFP